MAHIFAIGGGEIGNNETLEIDREIVAAAGKEHPNLLFIPTASGEPFGYVEKVEKVFADQLGCQVDTLYLIELKTPYERIKEQIEWADIIYVGGGDTRSMMSLWGRLGVDDLLIQAWMRGTIMSGLSAGAICWFLQGQSDSDTYETKEKRPYIYVSGTGLVPLFICPHHNEEDRAPVFDTMVCDIQMNGIALENGAAIEIRDHEYRILTSIEGAKAYLVRPTEAGAVRQELPTGKSYRLLAELE